MNSRETRILLVSVMYQRSLRSHACDRWKVEIRAVFCQTENRNDDDKEEEEEEEKDDGLAMVQVPG